MNKVEIIAHLNSEHNLFWDTALQIPNPTIALGGKWSVGQNVQHIAIGLSRLNSYLALPKAIIETNFGLSGRDSKSNETMTKVFGNAFENGVKSTDSFLPDEHLQTRMEELISQGKELLEITISNIQNWSEEELEKYNCPHPFLGKITVREILYFTIYHVQHHHETIKKMRSDYLID